MTVLSSDTFSRANQSNFGTASDGETWVRDAGVGVSNIVSNQGKIGPGGNDSQFVLGSQTAGTINILCRIKSGDAGNVAAVLFRYSNSGSINGYRAGIFGGNLIVDKYVAGVRSNIGSTSVGYVVGEEWWIRAVASSTSIKATGWKDGNAEPGSPQLNLTDSSVASGQYGISVFMSNDFTYFDSLTVTDNQASATTVTQSITESNALSESYALTGAYNRAEQYSTQESFSLTCAASTSEIVTLAEAYALAVSASSTESVLYSEQWTITNAFTISEATQSSESVVTALQVLSSETVTLSEAMSLALAISKSEINPVTESFFAGPPPTTAPTHVHLTLASARGTISLSSERGTITLTASKGIITLEGI
jgi:hypothetical protein